MTKQKFSEILLSRFLSLNDGNKYGFIETLFMASNELPSDNKEYTENEIFTDWAINISELLFPEQLKLIFPEIS